MAKMNINRNIAVILLSGGIDSTTCLALAHARLNQSMYDTIYAVSFNYEQRHSKELNQGAKICTYYGVSHKIITIPKLQGSLTDTSQEIPNIDYADIDGVSPTYVAFRNGTFLSLLAAYVHGELIKDLEKEYNKVKADLYFGAHASDAEAWAYPDCTPEFIGAMTNAIFIGTYQQIRLKAPLMELTKAEVINIGNKLKAPYQLTWSCYKGEALHCGTCPTCRDRRQAFISAGVADPTSYIEDM